MKGNDGRTKPIYCRLGRLKGSFKCRTFQQHAEAVHSSTLAVFVLQVPVLQFYFYVNALFVRCAPHEWYNISFMPTLSRSPCMSHDHYRAYSMCYACIRLYNIERAPKQTDTIQVGARVGAKGNTFERFFQVISLFIVTERNLSH